MVRAVLFDFHNTLMISDRWLALEIRTLPRDVLERLGRAGLVVFDEVVSEQADELYRALRLEVHETGHEIDAVTGVNRVLQELGFTVPVEIVAEIVDELNRECLPDISLREGAHEVLTCLKEMGLALGVVSSVAYEPFIGWAMQKLDLTQYFQTVVTSVGSGWYKSRPEIFLQALAQLGYPPEAAANIGDSFKFDVRGAKRAGLRAIWLDLGRPEPIEEGIADCIIHRLEELPPIIVEWNGR
ncbi:MAG: HAD family hydrolase [Chloroflexi bacterium]|nr:HAD family hydrolase [Chloroflexota bacterium]